MDAIDREILETVAADGRITVQELAARVRLGASATRERLRRLEATVIDGYTAATDPAALGFGVDALVEVDLPAAGDMERFEAALVATPAVVEALHATGDHDYVLRLRCRDTAELHTTVRGLKAEHGAVRTHTRVVLDQTLARRARLR
jgi:Lrp/AsnC family leucine-responsive transcriptional regulator